MPQFIRQVLPKRIAEFFPDGKMTIIKPKDKGLLKAYKRLQKAGLIKPSGKIKHRIDYIPCEEVLIQPEKIFEVLQDRQIALLREHYDSDSRFVLICGRPYRAIIHDIIFKKMMMPEYKYYGGKAEKLMGFTLAFTPEVEGTLLLPAVFIKDLAKAIDQ